MSTPENQRIVDALEEVWGSLLEATEGLTDGEWATPTACPGWDVKDNLSHLIGIERGLDGEQPPTVALRATEHLRNPIGEANELWVEARRALPGDEVRAEFAAVTARRLARLRAMSDEDFAEVGWSPVGQVPRSVFMEVRIMDSWIHEQDIRVALGRPGGRGGKGEATTLGRVDKALGVVVGKGAAAPEGASVAIEVLGPLGGRRRIEVVDGRAANVEGDDATVTISLDEETYVRRFAGRISAADALDTPTTSMVGDEALGGAVLDALAVMI
jgi:uncharacterized protein (TIGR03083 family)